MGDLNMTPTGGGGQGAQRQGRAFLSLIEICIDNMLLHMRTTLDLEDRLVRALKRRAVETGRTITAVVELALRELLDRETRDERPYELHWHIVPGGVQRGVDGGTQLITIDTNILAHAAARSHGCVIWPRAGEVR